MFAIPEDRWSEPVKVTAIPRSVQVEPRDRIVAKSDLQGLSEVADFMQLTLNRIMAQLPHEVSDAVGERFKECRARTSHYIVATAVFMFHYTEGMAEFGGAEYHRLQQNLKLTKNALDRFSEAGGLGPAFDQDVSLDQRGEVHGTPKP